MMNLRNRAITKAASLLLTFAVLQLYIQVNFAEQAKTPEKEAVLIAAALKLSATLATRHNRPITVNGNSVASGTTIFPNASIETPNQVGATVQIGQLGSLEIAPITSLTLNFSEGRIFVKVVKGGVVLRTNQGTEGVVETPQGLAGRIDPSKSGKIDVYAENASVDPLINQSAAATADAGANTTNAAVGVPVAAAEGATASTAAAQTTTGGIATAPASGGKVGLAFALSVAAYTTIITAATVSAVVEEESPSSPTGT